MLHVLSYSGFFFNLDFSFLFTGELCAVACIPTDPVLVAAGNGDDGLFLWKIGHADWASELQVAPGGFDGLVKIWDTSGKLKCTLKGPRGGIEWVRWRPKGHQFLAGSEDYSVWMWNADNRCRLFSGYGASVTCASLFSVYRKFNKYYVIYPGKTICTGSEDATLRIRNLSQPHHTEGLTCLSLSSDSTFCCFWFKGWFCSHSECHNWEASPGLFLVAWIETLPYEMYNTRRRVSYEGVTCLAWLGASKFLATGCCDGRIRLWNCLSGKCVATLKGHQHAIQSLSVSSNLEFLVSVSIDGTARVFEIRHVH
ncbi:WD40 repeat - like 10 [Theobroma cacao]|nr:WD40 repeat - like 10 [Theobroma cacao]